MQKCSYFVSVQVVRYKLFFIFYFFVLCVGVCSPIPLYPLLSRINWLELERLTLSIIMQMLLKDSLKGLELSSSGLSEIVITSIPSFQIPNPFPQGFLCFIQSAKEHLSPTYGGSLFIFLDTCPNRALLEGFHIRL